MNPVDYEIQGVNRFLSFEGVKIFEMHLEISDMFRENNMSEIILWKWFRNFKDIRTNFHDVGRFWRL